MADAVTTKPTPTTDQRESELFRLPPELRVIIYEYVFGALHVKHSPITTATRYKEQQDEDRNATSESLRNTLPLLYACQLVRCEALPIYRARLDQIEREIRAERGEEARVTQAEADEASERWDKNGDILALLRAVGKQTQLVLCPIYLNKDLEQMKELRERVV